MESAIPFPEDTVYLDHVMRCLDEAFVDEEGAVGRLDCEYNEFKRYLVEYRNETDAHEKLQGVAYLLYRFKDTLKAWDVAILSPNKVFSN